METGVVIATHPAPAAVAANRAGLLTSLVCAVAGLIGLFQRPRTTGTAICGLGVAVSILGFGLALLIEWVVQMFSGPI
jgi:predicted phage tail protein